MVCRPLLIGIVSFITAELLEAGQKVVVVDNLCNPSQETLTRVAHISGKECTFYQGDILDKGFLDSIFCSA